MEENKFDLKGFLNDPKAQANKAGAIRFLQSKGVIDAQGKPIPSMIKTDGGPPPATNSSSPFTSGFGSLPIVKQLNQFGVGVGTAIGKIGLSTGEAVSKLAGGVSKLMGNKTGEQFWGTTVPSGIEDIKQKIYTDPYKSETASIPGKIGTLTGTVMAYAAPGSTISKVSNLATESASVVSELAQFGKTASALSRIFAGASAEAAGNYALGYALSGGSTDQAKWQAAIAGTLKGVTAGVGEALKAAGVDTAFMNKIYRSTKAEQDSSLFRGGDGKTLADEAISRGITGDVKQQATQIQQGLTSAENQITAEFERLGNPTLKLDNPQRYIDVIQKRIELLDKNGATAEAQGLRASLANIGPNGEIPANAALGLRRLLDSMRQSKSFLSQTEELQASQAGLKEMSDALRGQINSVGETSSAMKDYQFYINAKNALIDYAKRSANKATLDFFDKLVLAESVFAHTPVGLGITAGRMMAARSPASAAQAIANLPMSSTAGSTARSLIGGATAQATKSPTQGR